MSDGKATASSSQTAPSDRRNFFALLIQGIFRNVGIELASEKLVLPYIYTTLGGAVLFVGLLTPAVIIAKLLVQLFGARLIAMTSVVKWYLALATIVGAMALAIISLVAADIPLGWLPAAFVATAMAVGVGTGLSGIAFQDMLGRVLSEPLRANLLFYTSAAVGVVTIVATIASQAIAGLSVAEEAWQDHVHLVWTGTAMMLLAALAVLGIDERRKPTGGRSDGEPPYFTALRAGMRRVSRLRWLRRFIVARVLLLSVEIAIPFFAVHAAAFYENMATSLTFFVLSSSVGLLVGGFLWPWASKRSIQRVLATSAGLGFGAAMLALARNYVPDLQVPATHAVMFAMLGLGTQGVFNGAALYVVNAAGDEERPYCVALANAVAGVAGIGLALIAGTISTQRGVIAGLMVMAVLNVAAVLYARTLVDPDRAGEPAGQADGLKVHRP